MAHNKMSINHRIMTVTPYWKPITMCHNWNSFTQNLLHGITFVRERIISFNQFTSWFKYVLSLETLS